MLRLCFVPFTFSQIEKITLQESAVQIVAIKRNISSILPGYRTADELQEP